MTKLLISFLVVLVVFIGIKFHTPIIDYFTITPINKIIEDPEKFTNVKIKGKTSNVVELLGYKFYTLTDENNNSIYVLPKHTVNTGEIVTVTGNPKRLFQFNDNQLIYFEEQ